MASVLEEPSHDAGWDFFVSYAPDDQGWAEWIAWELEEFGHRVLLQAWDMVAGSNWLVGVQDGLARANRTIVVLSTAYLQSSQSAAEWQTVYAADPLGLVRKIIPVRVEDCPKPGLLSQVASFDLFGLDVDAARTLLFRQVDGVRVGRLKPVERPAFPSEVNGALPPADRQAGIVSPEIASTDFGRDSTSERTATRKQAVLATKCLPVYLAIDTSRSMASRIDALNRSVDVLFDALIMNPLVTEIVALSIVSFNTDSHIVLPMSDIDNIDTLPTFAAGGSTIYSRLFELLKEQISVDMSQLHRGARAALRPIVFMLTDGDPVDLGWEDSFANLVDGNWKPHPHFITYGFGRVSGSTLARISTLGSFLADESTGVESAIQSITSTLIGGIVNSVHRQDFSVPGSVPGFDTIPPMRMQ